MRFVPTTEQKRAITKACKELTKKHKKKVKRLDDWCLRFHHKGSYFDYWPTTGRWVFAKGVRGIRCGAGNRYNKASSVEILMKAVNSLAEFAKKSREDTKQYYAAIYEKERFEFWRHELIYPEWWEDR